MRAILVKEFGDAEVMQVGEVRVPEPGRDEILVRILAAGVGPWDVEQRRGGWSGPLPYIPGREFAGLVVGDTGANADSRTARQSTAGRGRVAAMRST
jgi:NADPH:quinone reductase-like Zn-dependent oxidoreductase